MRSSLTRLVDSITRVVLLAPCLLICLACATPFPFEKLEKGMTTEAVRQEFGEPEAISTFRAFIPTGPQWVFDPSVGHPEPDTSCESERTTSEGRAEAGDTRYVARNYVSLWIEPHTASLDAERVSVDRGQPLKILGRRCQWCRVEDDAGAIGWVACVFLDASKP